MSFSLPTNTNTPNLKGVATEVKAMIAGATLVSSDPVVLSSPLPTDNLGLLAVDREFAAVASDVFYRENTFSVSRASDMYNLRSLPVSTRNKIVTFALPAAVGVNATRLRQLKSAFRNLQHLSLGTIGDFFDNEPARPAVELHQHLLNTHPALAELCSTLPNVAVSIRTKSHVFEAHELSDVRPSGKRAAKGVRFCRERVWAVSAPGGTVQVELVACNDLNHHQQVWMEPRV